MSRFNSEGVPRDALLWTLTQRDKVMRARKLDSCLLCCSPKVNEGGLCDKCMAIVTKEELKLVEKWMAGVGP
jgi:hypothetical protein